MIRLKTSKDFRYSGTLKYLIHYNYAAGKRNRYEVLIVTAGDPIVIGRELDLKTVRRLIALYEEYAPEHWGGDYQDALQTKQRVIFMMRKGVAALH